MPSHRRLESANRHVTTCMIAVGLVAAFLTWSLAPASPCLAAGPVLNRLQHESSPYLRKHAATG